MEITQSYEYSQVYFGWVIDWSSCFLCILEILNVPVLLNFEQFIKNRHSHKILKRKKMSQLPPNW